MKHLKRLLWLVPPVVMALFAAGIWGATGALLFPRFHQDPGCSDDDRRYLGEACGDLRVTKQFKFSDVKVPSLNGYDMPAWLIRADDNGHGPARGVVILVHGGGSDRRGMTRYVPYFMGRAVDVLALDLGCAGEAPCPVPGLTYGERESADVLSAYLFLVEKHANVFAMGTSAGAAAILMALPSMPKIRGVVVENPYASFSRLMTESPAAPKGAPEWMSKLMLGAAMTRGRFDGLQSAWNAVGLVEKTPILFMHGKADQVVPFAQTEQLAARYRGPKRVWLVENAGHAMLWDVDHAEYERHLTEFLDGELLSAAN